MPLRPRHVCAGGLLLGGLACGRPGIEDWSDQLGGDGPCLEVDLVDGLDGADEVDALFRCFDRHGHLAPLRPTAAALQGPGTPAPAEALARAQRAALAAGNDPLAGIGAVTAWVGDPDLPSAQVLDLTAELVTGQPAAALHASPSLAHDLSGSPVLPLRAELPGFAAALRDDPAALQILSDLLAHDALPTWLAGIAAASEAEGLDAWPRALGDARQTTLEPTNDTHAGATGDSLRDAVDQWLLREGPVLEAVAPRIRPLVDDPVLRRDLVEAVATLHADGRLAEAPAAAAWLASTALDGGAPNAREPSVLYRFTRLLALTNAPIECELDLWLTSFEWSWDNLAVQVLRIVAELEPGDVQGLAGLLGALGGNAVTEAALELAIDSGTCPSLTRETLDDLEAVVWLQEPEALPALEALAPLLGVWADHDRLPDLADAVTTAWDAGGVPPAEELLRDAGPTLAAGGAARFLGALADPGAQGLAPQPSLEGVLGTLATLGDDPGRVDALRRLLAPVAASDDGWLALDRAADLLARDGALAAALPTLRAIQAADPELSLYGPLRAWATDPDTVDALLELLSDPVVVDALLADTPSDDGPPPLGWLAERMVDGSAASLLAILSDLAHEVGASPESP